MIHFKSFQKKIEIPFGQKKIIQEPSMSDKDVYLLGISAFYHDSAACILLNGEIIAAAQEERFTRKKHDKNFPLKAIVYCLKEANISPDKLAEIIFYENPLLKFDRILNTYLSLSPLGFDTFVPAAKEWLKNKLYHSKIISKNMNKIVDKEINWKRKIKFSNHHYSHASSAFFPSPFERAAVLTLDGVGEWSTTSIAIGNKSNLKIIKEIKFPHSLGLLYSSFTNYLGFKVNSGEYKVMGLAPYGSPKYSKIIKDNLITIFKDGSFKLNIKYFSFPNSKKMINQNFCELFKGQVRTPESEITQREMDIAASIQEVTEEILVLMAKHIAKETGEKNLCLAGGVALNCVANGLLQKEKIFDDIWIQPAAGDAGGSIGAALAYWYQNYSNKRIINEGRDSMKGSYLGPSFDDNLIEKKLVECNAVFKKLHLDDTMKIAAKLLASHKVIGWMQGRMEFGPRALGNRSILADARSPFMQKKLNVKIKNRESFRPFAPSVLSEELEKWFDLEVESPYMLLVANVKKNRRLDENNIMNEDSSGFAKLEIQRSIVPAITHVNYSARVQTVNEKENNLFYKLIYEFNKITSCPMIINTSFNVRGEPIICDVVDAYNCFMMTDLDALFIGNFYLEKNQQKKNFSGKTFSKHELD